MTDVLSVVFNLICRHTFVLLIQRALLCSLSLVLGFPGLGECVPVGPEPCSSFQVAEIKSKE